ncbi:MAG: tRNA-binding protein [Alphaproteobacteria bacterium]|nr:tRNA-binding protein [Alphaproteobacteria bacterium]
MHIVDDPNSPAGPETDFETFRQVDIRLGTVTDAKPADGVRNPALKLTIDFGAGLGERTSLAQITRHYEPQEMIGRQVLAVVNFPPRQIGKHRSQVLVLGLADAAGDIVLVAPDQSLPNGARLA